MLQPPRSRLKSIRNCGTLLLALNLLAGQIGCLSAPCRNYAAFVLFLPVLISGLRPVFAAAGWLRRGLALALLVPILLSFRLGGVCAVFGVFLGLLLPFILGGEKEGSNEAQPRSVRQTSGLPVEGASGPVARAQGSTCLRSVPESRDSGPVQHVLVLLAAGIGLWLIARQMFPAAFVGLQKVSSLTCAFSSLLARPGIELGPSYSGVLIVLLFLIAHAAIFAASRPKEPRWLFWLAGGQLALLVPYQLLFHHWLLRWRLDSPWVMLGGAQLGLFLAGFVLVAIHLRHAALAALRAGPEDPSGRGVSPLSAAGETPAPRFSGHAPSWRVPAGKVAALAAACSLLMLSFSDGFWAWFQPRVQPRVLLYDDGTLDWSVPQYGRYGGMAGGMFGLLGPFLERHHCQAARGPLKAGALENADVLVVFNLMRKFPAEEKRRIWDFVARGGSLLAVGDHTGTTEIREPFNDLLAPVNIGFNFDCAMPRRMVWAEGLECFQHYTTCGLDWAADAQISVGASLSVGWPAWPLVVGPHGFSDKGDLQNRANGYLGDRQCSNDERLGDVVLVATARHQRGKVLVFGDTTSFQNGALPLSADFVCAIFEWLSLKEPRWGKGLSLLLSAAAVAVFWVRLGTRASWSAAWIGLFACFVAGYEVSVLAGRHCSRPLPAASVGGEALIDCSHLSRCSPDLWMPDGLGGLAQNLMRKHYLPVVTRRFSPQWLRQSRLVFLVAPARAFRAAERSAYEAFVREGGSLFICAGYEEAPACRDLLQRFGLRLRNLPLGPIGPETNSAKIHFLNAWPVTSDPAGTEVLCQRGEYPLIVCRHCQRGKVFLAGDSRFFLNRNLEMAESFNLENIQFLQKLVPERE